MSDTPAPAATARKRPTSIRERARYLVVDLDVSDGETILPSGKRGHVFASFHSRGLATVLAEAERKQGRTVFVMDSDHDWPESVKSGVRQRKAAVARDS